VVISDLHLGFEYNFVKKGIQINSKFFTQHIISEVNAIIKGLKPDGVILLGDIKDSIMKINSIERYHIPRFLKGLAKSYEVYLIPGNHDVRIEWLSPNDVSVASPTGITIGDTLFLHGHTMPSTKKSAVNKIVMGHLHPVLNKSDSNLSGKRVWIFMRVKKRSVFKNEDGYLDLVTMPSFNQFITPSSSFRRKNIAISASPIIGNVIKCYNCVDQALVVCLDGYVLGDERMLPFVT
jgi:putative SbcD/Mre11-related phosphoesterase